jgi:hypothetical protein
MADTTLERLVRVEVLMDEIRKDIANGLDRVDQRLAKIDTRIDKLEARVGSAEDAIKTVTIGWRALWLAGSAVVAIAAAIGALLSKWLPMFGAMPR